MKRTITIICTAMIWTGTGTHAQSKKHQGFDPNSIMWIPGGTAAVRSYYDLVLTPKDSTLLAPNENKKIKVNDFYLSDHEVTNGEYREFTDWVRDSMAMTLLAAADATYYAEPAHKTLNWKRRKDIWKEAPEKMKLLASMMKAGEVNDKEKTIDTRTLIYTYPAGAVPVYPDTSIWENPKLYNLPYANVYYWHPAYNNYPVVGVNWAQANAYCDWLTYHPQTKPHDYGRKAYFRLPTEEEWEYAALCVMPTKKKWVEENVRVFPWIGFSLLDQKGKYLANFGNIYDQNGVLIKNSNGFFDDYIATSPVKSFHKNNFGLYDMAGNVAEWTADAPPEIIPLHLYNLRSRGKYPHESEAMMERSDKYLDSVQKADPVTVLDDLASASAKIMRWIDGLNQLQLSEMKGQTNMANAYSEVDKATIEIWAGYALHNAKILQNPAKLRIVKGGSWANGPVYMEIASREAFPMNQASSRIGFRVAMDVGWHTSF